MSSLGDESILSAAPEQLSSKLGDETVILDIQSGVYFGLNPVAARVWDLVQQGKTVGAIRETILSEFDVTPDVCQRDLDELFEQMRAQSLISVVPTPQ